MTSSTSVGLGIIGLGSMGATLMRAVREYSDFPVRVAADPSESARLAAAGLLPGARLSADPDAVLSDPDIDPG